MGRIRIPPDASTGIRDALEQISKVIDQLTTRDLDLNARGVRNCAEARDNGDVPNLGQVRELFNGEDFKRKVQEILLATPPKSTSTEVDRAREIEFYDEFLSLVAGTSPPWRVVANAVAQLDSVDAHPGCMSVQTTAVANNIARLTLGAADNDIQVFPADVTMWMWIARLRAAEAAKRCRFGLSANAGNPGAADGIYFQYDTSVDTHWHFRTDAAGTTDTDTGIVHVDGNWIKFEARQVSSTEWWGYINDALVAKNSTNVPTAGMNFYFSLETLAGVTKIFDVDLAWMKLRPQQNRWD